MEALDPVEKIVMDLKYTVHTINHSLTSINLIGQVSGMTFGAYSVCIHFMEEKEQRRFFVMTFQQKPCITF